MATKMIILIALIVIFNTEFGSALDAKIDPNHITSKTKAAVQISCIPDEYIDAVSDGIMVMEIKKDSNIVITLRHKTELKYATGMEKKFQANGRIDDVGSQSYLRAALLNPVQGDAGRYECMLFYLDHGGSLKEKVAVANLTYTSLQQNSKETKSTPLRKNEETLGKISTLETRLKQLQAQLDLQVQKERNRPLFSAKLTNVNKLKTGSSIVFNEVLVSDGIWGYDSSSGIFTAPVSGIYNFELAAAMGKTNGFLNIDVIVDSQVKAGITAADKDFDDQSSVSFMVRLGVGSKVKAVLRDKSNASITVNTGNGWTLFSGFLVKEI